VAARLERLLGDRALRERLGRQGVERANRRFTWAGVADDVASLYEEVLEAYAPGTLTEAADLAVIDEAWEASVATLRDTRTLLRQPVAEAARELAECFARGGTVLVAGNGGSATDAQHLAAELVGRYLDHDREGLPCVALTCDGAVLTAWGNDVGFHDVFARQVRALARPGDVLVGISTSGASANLLHAFEAARERGVRTVGILGRDGGGLLPLSDIAVTVPAAETPRIQEVHTLVLHLLAGLVEGHLARRTTAEDVPLRVERIRDERRAQVPAGGE
jgi:phosphoheptose isomerase